MVRSQVSLSPVSSPTDPDAGGPGCCQVPVVSMGQLWWGVPGTYLWLKVCRPMDADAKTTDVQKLEV